MPTRPINLDPNYSFPGGSQRKASVGIPSTAPAPQAPPPNPGGGGSADQLQAQIMKALGNPSTPQQGGGNKPQGPGTTWGWDNFGVTSQAGQGSQLNLGPWSVDLASGPAAVVNPLAPLVNAVGQAGDAGRDAGLTPQNYNAGADAIASGDPFGNNAAAQAQAQADAQRLADIQASQDGAQFNSIGAMLGQTAASAAADYQGNLADFALQRALLGDQSANSKQGLQLSAAKQRELLDYQLKTGQRDLGLIGQDRGLIEAGKGFAGRELDLNKALRGLQHQSVGLNRKDIDLSDRNIELDRADILTKYNADRRHANQAATAGGSWFAPERMLTQKDLYSNLMTNAGRLDTRWQHNNLERGRADIEDLTIDNNAGRDQLGYDRSMNEIERALLANTQKANSVGDQSFSAQVNRSYLDPILANQLGGVDLGYRRGLLPIQTAERQNQKQYDDAQAAWYAWLAQLAQRDPGGDRG